MEQSITQPNLQVSQDSQSDNSTGFDSLVANIERIYAAPAHVQQPHCCCVQRSNTSSTCDVSY